MKWKAPDMIERYEQKQKQRGSNLRLIPIDVTVEEIIDLCPGCELPRGKTHAVYIDHRSAGFKQAAFEGCEQCCRRIARRIREGLRA